MGSEFSNLNNLAKLQLFFELCKKKEAYYILLLRNDILKLRKYIIFRYIVCDIKIKAVPLHSISVVYDINDELINGDAALNGGMVKWWND